MGAFGVLLGWEAIIKVIFRWGLEGAFLRLYYEQRDDAARRRLAGTIAIFLACANGAILAILIALSGVIDRWFFAAHSYQWAFVLMAVNCFVAGFLFLPLTLFRAREQAVRSMWVTVTRSLGTIAARLILVLGVGLGILGFVIADLMVSVVVTVALTETFRRMLEWRFSRPLAREALHYGAPQVPFGLLHQVATFADRFFLGLWLPPARRPELGAYQIGATIASVLKIVPVAFQTAWMPFAFETFTRRADAGALFARLATYWMAVLTFLTLAVIALTGSVIALVFPSSYQPAAAYVPVLAAGVALQAASWLPTTSLNIAKATRYYPAITTFSAIAAIAANAWLIPAYGTIGAAYGMAVGQIVQLAATVGYSQRAYWIPYEIGRLGKILIVGAATLAAVTSVAFASPVWTLLDENRYPRTLSCGSLCRPIVLRPRACRSLRAARDGDPAARCRQRARRAAAGRNHPVIARRIEVPA